MGNSVSNIPANLQKNDNLLQKNYQNLWELRDETLRRHYFSSIKNVDPDFEYRTMDTNQRKDQICSYYRVFDDKVFEKWDRKSLGLTAGKLGLINYDAVPSNDQLCSIISNYVQKRIAFLDKITENIQTLAYCSLTSTSIQNLNEIRQKYYVGSNNIDPKKGFDLAQIVQTYIAKKLELDDVIHNAKERKIQLSTEQQNEKENMEKLAKLLYALYDKQTEYINLINDIYTKLHSPYYVTLKELTTMEVSFDKTAKSLELLCTSTFRELAKFNEYASGKTNKLSIKMDEKSVTDRIKGFFKS